MTAILRHAAVRLWVSLLAAGPAGFVLVPLLQDLAPLPDPPVCFGILLLLAWIGSGHIMLRVGEKTLDGLVREAQSWERAGVLRRSEALYRKAVQAMDSFWLPPWRSGRSAAMLTGSIARFSLAWGVRDPSFERASAEFLTRFPENREIAALWLKARIVDDPGRADGPRDQEILTSLAAHHDRDPEILPLLVRAFLSQGRSDYAARRVYGLAMKAGSVESDLGERLARWVAAGDFIPVVPPCAEPPEAETLLAETGSGGRRPGRMTALTAWAGRVWSSSASLGGVLWERLGEAGTAGVALAVSFRRRAGRFLAQETVRVRIRWGLMGAAACACVLFMLLAMGHLLRPTGREASLETVEFQMPRPYTLQVAAYLKKEHAEGLLARLRDKGLDARLAVSAGGGRTWFLVRVSSFTDRGSAREYGLRLQEEKLIDDFFVDNNP
jgi:hypothetical protein